jgi:hypothetical protein
MKKKDKIIILKAKVIELERELKSAQRTCAKQDNEIDMLKETIRCHVENNQIVAQVLMDKNKSERESKYDDAIDSLDRAFKYGISKLLEENKENFLKSDVSSLTEKYNPSKPIESTKELFEGKGYVYIDYPNNKKLYISHFGYTDEKIKAKIFNSFDEFEKLKHPDNDNNFHFEPIEKEQENYEIIIKAEKSFFNRVTKGKTYNATIRDVYYRFIGDDGLPCEIMKGDKDISLVKHKPRLTDVN